MLEEIVRRMKELDNLAARAKELGYKPAGVVWTPQELDELFEDRKLIKEVTNEDH